MHRPRLFTIGYQGAALDRFLACLAGHGIRTLADIRFTPFSRRAEFGQKRLQAAVEAAGLVYRHWKDLGNPPPGRAAAMAGDTAAYRRLFQAHLDTAAAQAALAEVAALAETGPVCLMCLERDPKDCHRSMVAERLARDGAVDVEHLRPADAAAAQMRLL